MTRLLTVIAAVALSSFLIGACSDTPIDPPYYDSADFTPQWTPTVPRPATFSLVDQQGQAFSSAKLAGTVHVVSFIYTRCSVICPALVSSLKRVQDQAGDGVAIVSFSVTPDLDSPSVLADFGRERGIDPAHWTLLTGDRVQIYGLARDVYFAGDNGLRATLATRDAVLHTEKLVLVDRSGRLRGVYDGTLPREVDHLIDDARALFGGV